jgi:tRNA(fMet)-specific endonuclease VapC
MEDNLYEVLVDTSVVIDLFRRQPGMAQHFARVYSVVSPIVLGELYHGALRAALTAREMNYIAQLVQTSQMVLCDEETSLRYATIRNDLQRRGLLIPENDMWIAASAIQHGLSLATRDAHFERVDGLVVERW